MIVRARSSSFCCLTQHYHAQVAGRLAEQWPLPHFAAPARRDEVLLAIREHDRGWIPLNEAPGWNEQQQAPYSKTGVQPHRLAACYQQAPTREQLVRVA